MIAVLQRASEGRVTVDDRVTGEIGITTLYDELGLSSQARIVADIPKYLGTSMHVCAPLEIRLHFADAPVYAEHLTDATAHACTNKSICMQECAEA